MKIKTLQLSIFILLLSGTAHLQAERITYYFTGKTDSIFGTHSNWNTNRDGTGDSPATGTAINSVKNAIFIVSKGDRDTIFCTTTIGFYSPVTVEENAILKQNTLSGLTNFGVTDTSTVTINTGGKLIVGVPGKAGTVGLYPNARLVINGKLEVVGCIKGNNTTGSRTIEVGADGELTVNASGISRSFQNALKLLNNGTVTTTGAPVELLSLEGQGTLNLDKSLTVTDLAASTFLQAGGGTVAYSGVSGTLTPLSAYNNLEIKNSADLLTLNGNSTVAGNLTVADSKVVTEGTLSVAGDVAVSNLAEGSALNVTLNGTRQNIEGVFSNLEIAAGTVATLTGDLTVDNLVLVGTLFNPNNYTLTITNQTDIDAYKTQLLLAISGVSLYTEADYTVESWAVLSAAVTAGQALLAEGADPTTVELEVAKNAVTAAIEALVTNLSVLESYVSTIKANYGNPTVYTEATYNALLTAITAAETFLENKAAITPTELAAYKGDIDTAIAGLVREVYTFYLQGGTANNPANWNIERDGTGEITAADFIGNTYIAPANVGLSSLPVFYGGSHLILEASETPISTSGGGLSLDGSNVTVESGRTWNGNITLHGQSVVRIKSGGKLTNREYKASTPEGGKIIVDEGGIIENGIFGIYNDYGISNIDIENNGTVEAAKVDNVPNSQFVRITGTGTIIANSGVTLADAAGSTFLQSGGGTLIYRTAATLLPSYNHLTIEEITTAATLSREVTTDTVPVYGNLLLSNNHRRVEFSNPLAVAGDFTVDYDIEDEAVVRATFTVAGNVSLSGLLPEDHALNVTLAGSEEQDLSGAGFTNLTLPDGTSAVLTGNLSIEATLTLNGVLDRNGRTLSFGNRSGNGILTDGLLAAALQDSIDQANADYPDGGSYTTASWQALQTAIDAGEALLAGETPAEVAALEAAIAAIAAAVEGLESATGLVPPSGDTWRIHAGASTLSVTGNVDLRVVTLAGREAYHGRVTGEKTFRLPAGVYIVTVNGRSGKVVVR